MEEGSGEICLEEEVVRLHERGLSVAEISGVTGLQTGWVEEVVSRNAAGGEED
jgi:hypothetical protein